MYTGLQPEIIFATILYATLGIFLMILYIVIFDKIFNLDLHKELVKDQNVAFGILLAGIAIGTSLIIAASIMG